MILLNVISALLLCASASASDNHVTVWSSKPTARSSIDANKCDGYYSLFEQCLSAPHGFLPMTQTNTMAPDIAKNCSSLAHSWGSIYKACGSSMTGLPKLTGHHGPTAAPVASPSAEVRALEARKKKKPKPTCNIEGDSPFDSCGSNKRGYPDNIEEDSIFSGPSPTSEEQKRDSKKKNPKPTCNIEGDSPFDTCGSDKREYPDNIEEDSIFSGPSPTSEEQKRDPKKKKPKPTCNIENDSPFESCGSDKRDAEDSVKQGSDSSMVKRASRCPHNFHFLTAEHDTYHYWFCCPAKLDKMLLPESYAAAPKCCTKSDRKCNVDAVDGLEGCDPSDEVTDYGGVKGCRIRATKNNKREAIPGSTGLTAGHDPVTSLGPDSDLQPTTYPVAPPDHGQYCHFGGCGKGKVTSYVDGLYCQCVPAPPPTPITVTAHNPVTGFIRDVVGRDVEAAQTIRLTQLEPYLPHSKTGTITVTITIPAPSTMQTSTKQDSVKALGESNLI